MNLICASSVSLAREAFAPLGNLTLLPESDITPATIRNADAVITRSKTRLDHSLFAGSHVKFAGTCTAGTDHVDPDALRALGIHIASAPGCNANAVSEYCVAALLDAHASDPFPLAGKTLGIIGHGQVGTRVEAKAHALGMRVLRNDPPKAATDASGPWTDLPDLLQTADIVTLHVPLVEHGPWPTRNLLSPTMLQRMKPGAILLNACRGEVLPTSSILHARRTGRLSRLHLDVWDPEPDLPPDLLNTADLATPHIAGHSVEGKVNGTRQIHDALCAFFGLVHLWDPEPLLPSPEHPLITLPQTGDLETRLRHAVRAAYDIRRDDQDLRDSRHGPLPERFTRLRRGYRDRREFPAHRVAGLHDDERPMYRTLGFQVEST